MPTATATTMATATEPTQMSSGSLTSKKELMASLERHNAVFEKLMNLIPAKYYFPADPDEQASKFQKHSKKVKTSKKGKDIDVEMDGDVDADADADEKREKKIARREKFDPANHKTVLEIQNERLAAATATASSSKGKRKAPPSSDDEEGDDDVDDSDDDDGMHIDASFDLGDGDSDATSSSNENADAAMDMDVDIHPLPVQSDITTLREKLHAKMASLRRGPHPNSTSTATSTAAATSTSTAAANATATAEPSSRDELLEQRRAQRTLLREKKRRERKARKEAEKEQAKKGKLSEKEVRVQGKITKTQLLVPDDPSNSNPKGVTTVSFPTLSAPASTSASAKTKTKVKALKHLPTSSNPTTTLSLLTTRKQKLSQLSLSNPEKRKEIEEKDTWAKAEAKMGGVKVYDVGDEGRLRKAVKRREKEKAKSRKEWDDRKTALASAMAAKQKKRADNIAMRNERRHEKHKGGKKGATGSGKGKGKARPGFEGKAFGAGGGGKKGKGKS